MPRHTINTKGVSLSPLQADLLAAMPEGKPITSSELIDAVYGKDQPFNARGTVLTAMSILSRKLAHMKDGRRIVKGPRKGPRPITYKLEGRKR